MNTKPTNSRQSKREAGFYWVRVKRKRRSEVAQYLGLGFGGTGYWSLCGGRETWYDDSDIAEVLSDRIPPPTKRKP